MIRQLVTTFRAAAMLSLILGTAACLTATTTHGDEPMLAHNVFFSLKDDSSKARQTLVDGCKQYLSKHPGTVFFAAGVLAEDLQREVNDRDFDVALHVVFEDRAAHDKYQEADEHHKFIEEFKDNWEKVRVFDAVVER